MTTTSIPQVQYKVHPRENVYFGIKVFFAVILYYLLFRLFYFLFETDNPLMSRVKTIYVIYAVAILLFIILTRLFLIGYLKGNAIKVSAKQFPDIYNIVAKQAIQLGIDHMPDVYIMQSGGVLNAFVTRFMGVSYLVLFSDVLAEAYQQKNQKVIEFIIGHEMGHIKRKHILKRLLLLPASAVPLLGAAYSRGCEYTCDRIGHALCPEGSRQGMILLAAGRGIFTKVNVAAYLEQLQTENGFSSWIYEKFASHPNITKRVRAFDHTGFENEVTITAQQVPVATEEQPKPKSDDHSRFLPQ